MSRASDLNAAAYNVTSGCRASIKVDIGLVLRGGHDHGRERTRCGATPCDDLPRGRAEGAEVEIGAPANVGQDLPGGHAVVHVLSDGAGELLDGASTAAAVAAQASGDQVRRVVTSAVLPADNVVKRELSALLDRSAAPHASAAVAEIDRQPPIGVDPLSVGVSGHGPWPSCFRSRPVF